jgi:hypothetical protein
MLAAALEDARPVTLSPTGELTIRLKAPNEFTQRKIEAGRDLLAAALREAGTGLGSVHLEVANADAAPRRLTHELLKVEQVARLKRSDALLNAAFDALDLELVDE